MNKLNGTTRTLRVITVALIGLTSLAVLGGCASGIAPIAAPKQVPSVGSTSEVMAVAFNPTTNLFYTANGAGNTVSVF